MLNLFHSKQMDKGISGPICCPSPVHLNSNATLILKPNVFNSKGKSKLYYNSTSVPDACVTNIIVMTWLTFSSEVPLFFDITFVEINTIRGSAVIPYKTSKSYPNLLYLILTI